MFTQTTWLHKQPSSVVQCLSSLQVALKANNRLCPFQLKLISPRALPKALPRTNSNRAGAHLIARIRPVYEPHEIHQQDPFCTLPPEKSDLIHAPRWSSATRGAIALFGAFRQVLRSHTRKIFFGIQNRWKFVFVIDLTKAVSSFYS